MQRALVYRALPVPGSRFPPGPEDAAQGPRAAPTRMDKRIATPLTPLIVPRAEHGISRKDISPNALRVLYKLREGGFQGYLVGGAVRDLLVGGHPKDFDVATDATPEQVKGLFRRAFIIGRRFRIVHVIYGRGREHEVIEVSTFRALLANESAEQVSGNEKTSKAELAGKSEFYLLLQGEVNGGLHLRLQDPATARAEDDKARQFVERFSRPIYKPLRRPLTPDLLKRHVFSATLDRRISTIFALLKPALEEWVGESQRHHGLKRRIDNAGVQEVRRSV